MDKEKLDYLKNKQLDFHNSLIQKAKEENLCLFLNTLKNIIPVKIIQKDFPLDKIAKPTLVNLPDEPKYINCRFESSDEVDNVKSIFKNWITEQKSETLLIKNENLIDTNDWIEVDTKTLLNNFDFAFEKLHFLYTIIFSSGAKSFINSFEFENDVTIYKGNVTNSDIKYYC